jgi:MFS transporter, SP family, galactose:H+ symporter
MAPKKTKEHCTTFLFFTVIIAALGGLLFGYHTGVISGALAFLTSSFRLSIADQAMVVSILLIGGLAGALSAGPIADKIGRKRAIALTSVLFVVGAAIISVSGSYEMLLWGRFISGLGVGAISVAGPIYLAEISPSHYRGAFVACYQLAIAIGILMSYFVNYLFASSADWRWMFAIGIFPALFQMFALFFVPESPPWLFKNGLEDQGIKALERLRKDKEWTHQIRAMENSASHHKHGHWKALLSPQLRFVMIVGFCLSIFQQITGVNTVIFYAPKIFQSAGIASTTGAILATVGVGIINVIATFFSTWILDKVGRRILLLIGMGGMTVCLALLSSAYFIGAARIDIIAFISLIGYIGSFAIGIGPITWVILSEIYPLKVRGKAMTVAIFGNWVFNYLVSLTFLDLIGKIGPQGTFLMYALISAVAFWFIYRYIPETKGKSLEEIESLLIR